MTDAEFLRELADGILLNAPWMGDAIPRLREIAGRLAQVPPREPTEAMIDKGLDQVEVGQIPDLFAIWRAMYDAAQPPSAPAPCPDGEACPDARRYGNVHPAPSAPAEDKP